MLRLCVIIKSSRDTNHTGVSNMNYEKKTKKSCLFCNAKTVVITYMEFEKLTLEGSETVTKKVNLCKSCDRSKII